MFEISSEIEAEFKALFMRFIEQYSEDDSIPDNAYDSYCREHGSKELLSYIDECDRLKAEAASRGCRY